jgi:hypothetical protein
MRATLAVVVLLVGSALMTGCYQILALPDGFGGNGVYRVNLLSGQVCLVPAALLWSAASSDPKEVQRAKSMKLCLSQFDS